MVPRRSIACPPLLNHVVAAAACGSSSFRIRRPRKTYRNQFRLLDPVSSVSRIIVWPPSRSTSRPRPPRSALFPVARGSQSPERKVTPVPVTVTTPLWNCISISKTSLQRAHSRLQRAVRLLPHQREQVPLHLIAFVKPTTQPHPPQPVCFPAQSHHAHLRLHHSSRLPLPRHRGRSRSLPRSPLPNRWLVLVINLPDPTPLARACDSRRAGLHLEVEWLQCALANQHKHRISLLCKRRCCRYSRKNFTFPLRQPSPHTSFQDEVGRLRKLLALTSLSLVPDDASSCKHLAATSDDDCRSAR
jgi:hypothetical protein